MEYQRDCEQRVVRVRARHDVAVLLRPGDARRGVRPIHARADDPSAASPRCTIRSARRSRSSSGSTGDARVDSCARASRTRDASHATTRSCARCGASRRRIRPCGSCARRAAIFPSTTRRARRRAASWRSRSNPDARDRSDAAAARALSARRRDPLLRHPDDSRRDGARPFVRRGRGSALRAPGARRSRDRARSPCPTWRSLAYVFDAVAQIKRELAGRVPLIGFAGSPFTLACYMIEGGGSSDFATVRKMAYARPDLLARIVDVNARAVTAYLDEQIDARRRRRDDLRHVGRAAHAPTPIARSRWRRCARSSRRSRTVARARRSCSRKGGGAWLRRHRGDAARRAWASTGPSTSPRRARESARASRCRAISIRWCC